MKQIWELLNIPQKIKKVKFLKIKLLNLEEQKFGKNNHYDNEYYSHFDPSSNEMNMHPKNFYSNISKYESKNISGKINFEIIKEYDNKLQNNSCNIDEYNSNTLIIHSDQENGTVKYQENESGGFDSKSKNNFGEHSQYQQYVGFMKNADQEIKNQELILSKQNLEKEISKRLIRFFGK